MSEVTHEGQQIGVHMMLGFIPVLRVRKAVPNNGYGWEWSRWRLARVSETITINAMLMQTWRN